MIDLGTISRRHLILSRYTSDSLDISHAGLYRLLAIHEHYSLVRYRLLARSGFSGPDFRRCGNRVRRRCCRRAFDKERERPTNRSRAANRALLYDLSDALCHCRSYISSRKDHCISRRHFQKYSSNSAKHRSRAGPDFLMINEL